MKKVFLLIISILLLTGCGSNDVYGEYSNLEIYCDKKYGIEYIRDNGVHRGGITVRLDENGNVIHCK